MLIVKFRGLSCSILITCLVVLLAQNAPVPELIVTYLNRLSDYLFVLARYIVFKNNGIEVAWRPRM